MEKNQKYLEDLQQIRSIMNRSSRFISLSGLSGILAGIFALAGALLAYQTVYKGQDYLGYRKAEMTSETTLTLILIAVAVLTLSLGSGILLTIRKAKKENHSVWDMQTKRLLINLFIPLVAGGILCLIFISKGFVGLVAPLTLIFYGLALVNASKYSLDELRSLGLLQVTLGLIAAYFIGFGLLFWSIGFGVLHIVYGIYMHRKHGN